MKNKNQKPWTKPSIERDFSKLTRREASAALAQTGGSDEAQTAMREGAFASQPRVVGECYVFARNGHHSCFCEVAVLWIKGLRFKVARACDVCEALLAPRGSKKRKLQTWTCTSAELW